MVPVRDIVFAVASGAALLGVCATFIGVKVDDPPTQYISPLTGFPTWHAVFEDEVKEINMSFILLALIFSAGASYAAYRATRPPSRSLTGFVTISTGNEEPSTQINQFIKWYIYATLIAVVAYLLFDVGKIWAVAGALHNLFEVALLIVFYSGGRVSSMSFGLYLFTYVCITIVTSVYLHWPLDAIFFRWQGLCSDFGLILVFVRTYIATKKQLDAFGNRDRHDEQLAKGQEAADRLSQEQHKATTMESSSSLHSVNLTAGQSSSVSPNGPGSPLPTTTQSSHNPLRHIQSGWKKFVALAPTLNGDDHDHDQSIEPLNGHGASAARAISSPTPGSVNGHNHIGRPRFGGEPAQTVVTLNTTTTNGPHAGNSKVNVIALNQDNDSIWGVQWHNPDQLWLLIAASIFHVVGNCVTTIWSRSVLAMAVFQISYGISYPLYAYYLYVDNHALRQTKVYLAENTKLKTLTGACLSLLGATVTIRLGLLVATKAASHTLAILV
ncbi:hypothetical protein BGX28_010400 [Mortierella sp. GBA30]|nr:hypothetical protein BGX28_010400 [Mortierella sp. GBA30]